MAIFDLHDKCARCREKLIGEDDYVKDRPCSICDSFSEVQQESLATPTYRIRKEKKSGLLVSPKEVTDLASVNDNEPTFQSPAGPSVQLTEQSTPQGPSTSSFVTSEQFLAMSDKWVEQFARMEALLSRGNIVSTPQTSVSKVPSQELISNTPFLAPAARPTGPVETLAAQDAYGKSKKDENKDKNKGTNQAKIKILKPQKSVTALNHRFSLKLPPVLKHVLFLHQLDSTLDWSWTNSPV